MSEPKSQENAAYLDTGDPGQLNPRSLKFSAGKIDLKTGEVELEKEVSESAKEFWEDVEKFYPLKDN